VTPGPFIDELKQRAAALRGHVVLSEGTDDRVREAAAILERERICRVTVVTDPSGDPRVERVAGHLLARKPEKAGRSMERARHYASQPLLFAAGLVAIGEADATVGGSLATTADVLRAAFWAVGPAPGITTVSSAFYMVTRDRGVLSFTDCGVVQYPSAEQLADIAVAAARDRVRIVGDRPRVAFLSHGTRGSAEGESILRVRAALARFREIMPGVPADGELQADAALVAGVAERKAPDSVLGGDANVLVFPDLDSGNIAYKLVQRLAHAVALGPIVQGLARPCCDLSRGASADDIALVAAIALLQSSHP